MIIKLCKILQDGKLTPTAGRIVIYRHVSAIKTADTHHSIDDIKTSSISHYIDISHGPSRDHNDLLRSLAAKFKLPKDAVISNAIRLYWDRVCPSDIIVCPVRKLDEDMFYAQESINIKLIESLF